ncbi:MAG: hypothetical protein U9O20_03515 [Patescibacteria group bacterium]|nr:hypothetical protein [Patescibacteria group bacterium]
MDIIDTKATDPQPSKKVTNAFDDVIASRKLTMVTKNKAIAKKELIVGETETKAKFIEIKVETS